MDPQENTHRKGTFRMKDTQEEPLTLVVAGMANTEFLALCRGLPISRAQHSVLSAARKCGQLPLPSPTKSQSSETSRDSLKAKQVSINFNLNLDFPFSNLMLHALSVKRQMSPALPSCRCKCGTDLIWGCLMFSMAAGFSHHL